jgi:hypothetical protein
MSGQAHVSLRSLLIGSTVLLTLLLAAPAAQAMNGDGCPGQVLEQPFAPWDDNHDYTLMPDGDLSAGAEGWELDGAEVVDDNEPWFVHGGDTPAAVRLEGGDSATTPPLCITRDHPTMRYFVRGGGEDFGTLTVEAVIDNGIALPIDFLFAAQEGDEWEPSSIVALYVNLFADEVSFRFRATGGGTWTIDDVYVDPYGKG